jgi:hypothetical protein
MEAIQPGCERCELLNFWLPRPMSQISAIFGTDDDQEILTSLYLIANVSEKLILFLASADAFCRILQASA